MTASDDFRAPQLAHLDFLGVFAVVRRGERILMVQNARVVHGVPTTTWDLPGGQVEPGELLIEALARELDEETGLALRGPAEFLFVQEGERVARGRRRHAWRSFFFALPALVGEPRAGNEILDVAWLSPSEIDERLHAPYHDSFREWLRQGGHWFRSRWDDPA